MTLTSKILRRLERTGQSLAGLAPILTAIALSACSGDDGARASSMRRGTTPEERAPGEITLPEVTPSSGFPAKVKNYDGHTAVLEAPPQRILAGNASLLDGLLPLIDPGRMPALPSTALSYSSLTEGPGIWGEVPLLKHFDAEEILEPNPDLVVIHAYQAGPAIDRIIERDVPVVVFPVCASWKHLIEQIECLARLVGEQERGSKAIAALEERRHALQEKGPRSGLRVLPYGNYGSGGMTAGAGTTWQIMIELAGMRNAAAEAGLDGHPDIDFEQLLSIDPDFILIAKSEGQSGSGALEILTSEPLLADLRAIRDQRFLVLPEYLYSSASQELLSAAERIAEQADAQLTN